MSLPRVPAAAVVAAAELDRADKKDELEAIWQSSGCDAFKGAARRYVMTVYQSVIARLDGNARALQLARAI